MESKHKKNCELYDETMHLLMNKHIPARENRNDRIKVLHSLNFHFYFPARRHYAKIIVLEFPNCVLRKILLDSLIFAFVCVCVCVIKFGPTVSHTHTVRSLRHLANSA